MRRTPCNVRLKNRFSTQQSQEFMYPSRIDALYPLCMELSAWVKLARTQKGWTQERLAEELDVTKGNVSAWENSRHEPGWAQIIKMGRLTGVPLPIPEDLRMQIPNADVSLLEQINSLAPEDRAMVTLQIKRFADLTSKKVNEAGAEKDGTIKVQDPHEETITRGAVRSSVQSTKRVSDPKAAIRRAGQVLGGNRGSQRKEGASD